MIYNIYYAAEIYRWLRWAPSYNIIHDKRHGWLLEANRLAGKSHDKRTNTSRFFYSRSKMWTINLFTNKENTARFHCQLLLDLSKGDEFPHVIFNLFIKLMYFSLQRLSSIKIATASNKQCRESFTVELLFFSVLLYW